jgi:hypothetical protein
MSQCLFLGGGAKYEKGMRKLKNKSKILTKKDYKNIKKNPPSNMKAVQTGSCKAIVGAVRSRGRKFLKV